MTEHTTEEVIEILKDKRIWCANSAQYCKDSDLKNIYESAQDAMTDGINKLKAVENGRV